MHGHVFNVLKSLTTVPLEENVCINENFLDDTRIQVLPQTVTNLCSSCENNIEISVCRVQSEYADEESNSNSQRSYYQEIILKEARSQNTAFEFFAEETIEIITENTNLIEKLRQELADAESAKVEAMTMAKRTAGDMKKALMERNTAAQTNLQLSVRHQSLIDQYNLSVEQESEVQRGVERQDEEISNFKEKVKCVAEKIAILSANTC